MLLLNPREKKKIVAVVILSVLLFYIFLTVLPRTPKYTAKNVMMTETDVPVLVAHRGGDGEFPGNTLEAFYNAYSIDKNAVLETDACLTKDGVLILSHNVTLNKYTNETGAVIDWNYSDLISEKVNFGYRNKTENDEVVGERIPFKYDGVERYPTDVTYPDGISARDERVFLATTFEELLTHFPNNRISVEIKQDGDTGIAAFNEALRLIEKYDAFDRVIVASFHKEVFEESKRAQREGLVPSTFMYSPETGGIAKFYILDLLGLGVFYGDGAAILQIPMEQYGLNFAKRGLIDEAHKHNIAVHYWTINNEGDMRALIEIGADGIMTDYPSMYKKVLEEYYNG